VSCTSSSSCVAVGDDSISSDMWQTLSETWNGTSWSVTPSQNPGNFDNFPSAVSCTSSTNCVMVGDYYNGSVHTHPQTLIESYTGSWSTTSSPDPGPKANSLNGVSCASANECIAGGGFSTSDGVRALAETGTT
jgi:hypothetical protein